MDFRVYLLAATVFLAGIAENICVGILPEIAAGLRVSTTAAGQLTTIFSAVFALATLAAVPLVARAGRRFALSVSLATFAAANLAAAASPDYASLFGARMLMAASCATLILVATRLAAALTSPERHGRAIGIVFMGISASLVLGVPIGMQIAQWWGWRAVFVAIAAPVLPLAGASALLFVPAMMLWASISWSISPIVQNYLIRTAPELADTSVGFNVSAMHVGVALGSAFGGVLVGRGALLATPWAGSALVAVALGFAAWAVKPSRGGRRAPAQTGASL